MGTVVDASRTGGQPKANGLMRPIRFLADLATGKLFRRDGTVTAPYPAPRPPLHDKQKEEERTTFVFEPERIVWEMLSSPKEERARLVQEVERNANGLVSRYHSLEKLLHALTAHESSGRAKAEVCEENVPHARHLIEKHMLRILIGTTMDGRGKILSSLSREQLNLLEALIKERPNKDMEDPVDSREYKNLLMQISSERYVLKMKEDGIFTKSQTDENGNVVPWNPHANGNNGKTGPFSPSAQQ